MKYLEKDPDLVLDVPQEDTLTVEASRIFGRHSDKQAPSTILPMQKGVTDRLSGFAKSNSKRLAQPKKSKYNTDKLMSRCYKPPSQQEDNWSNPHVVPPEMLTLVDPNKRVFDNKANTYVLKTSSESGRREEKLRADLKRSQTSMRVQNSLSISIAACQEIMAGVTCTLMHLADDVKDNEKASATASELITKMVDLNNTMIETEVNSNDLFKLQADSYIKAAMERREVWLASSAAHADCQHELKALPISVPKNACLQKSFVWLGLRAGSA